MKNGKSIHRTDERLDRRFEDEFVMDRWIDIESNFDFENCWRCMDKCRREGIDRDSNGIERTIDVVSTKISFEMFERGQ